MVVPVLAFTMPFPIRVRDVMSSPVYTTEQDATVKEAAAECFERDINSLVVIEDGNVVGVLTGTDLLEVLGTAEDPAAEQVGAIMSSPVVTTGPETPVRNAVEKMYENDIARLVVIDGEEPVGLVSTDDVTRYVPQAFHRHELGYEPSETPPKYAIRKETAYEKADWIVECTGLSEDELSVGDRVEFTKTISEQDVRTFAAASGDTNKLHLDEQYAAETRFGRRIAHGTLVSGLISAALARLPGLTIYLSQDLSFLAPVDIGKRVTAAVEIVGTFGENKYELTTDVFDGDGEQVIEGEAAVLIDSLPEISEVEVDLIA